MARANLVTGGLRSVAYGFAALSLFAQASAFDIALIKPNPSLPLMKIGPEVGKGEVTGTRVTLLDLVMAAYDVTAPQVSGPGWLDGDRFDIVAKAVSRDASKDELRRMLRGMLAERFHLVVHTETRETPVYDLVVARGGIKMLEHGSPVADGPQPEPKKYPNVKNVSTMAGSLTIAQIAHFLSDRAGRPIVDKTGLDKKYDFHLTFIPALQADGGGSEFAPPDLFTAVQDEMGLKLQPSKAELPVVVVEQMDRMPTEN